MRNRVGMTQGGVGFEDQDLIRALSPAAHLCKASGKWSKRKEQRKETTLCGRVTAAAPPSGCRSGSVSVRLHLRSGCSGFVHVYRNTDCALYSWDGCRV